MQTIILYVWVLDIFLYANTELFLVFWIFFNIGVLFFNIVSWYCDYIDDQILSENRELYSLILPLKKQFMCIRCFIIPFGAEDYNRVSSIYNPKYYFPILAFISIAETSKIAISRYNVFLRYLNSNKYLYNLLSQIYIFELKRLSVYTFQSFSCLIKRSNDHFEVYNQTPYCSFSNPIFATIVNFQNTNNCMADFQTYWIPNILCSNFIEII